MSRIVLIRHVETAMAGRFCGHSDPGPNASGELQIVSVVDRIEPLGIGCIYSSDLRRAARTAASIGQRLGIDVRFRPGLREINFGLWEGMSWPEIEGKFAGEAKLWVEQFPSRSAPGGEAYEDFAARVENEFASVFREMADRTTAIVTHRGVLQYALKRFFDVPETDAWEKTAPYGAMVTATNDDGKWRVLP